MKKPIIPLIVLLFVLFHPPQTTAEVNPAFSFGTQTDPAFSFSPFFWTTGFHLDVFFSGTFGITPEVMLLSSGFEFQAAQLLPGILLNINMGGFCLGAGAVRPVAIGTGFSGFPPAEITLKINSGYMGRGYRILVYYLSPFNRVFRTGFYGLSLGFSF